MTREYMTQASNSRYGVLLLNMGGPSGPADVEEYIYRLLADPDMIRMPLGFLLQRPLARMIARRRAPKVIKRYGLIGGGSPLGGITSEQTAALQAALHLPVAHAMRYTTPPVAAAVDELASAGVERPVVIPLYPQYSTVSTLSAIRDFERQANGRLDYRLIDRHYRDKQYLEAMREPLRETLRQLDPDLKPHILFVAHSIPEAYVRAGDPYAHETEETVRLIMSCVETAVLCSLAYSSRVGPVKWRGPSLEEELRRLADLNIRQLVVQPLSFVSENLETLFDLDIDFKESCAAAGITAFHRIPTLGTSPRYINSLAAMARTVIENWEQGHA